MDNIIVQIGLLMALAAVVAIAFQRLRQPAIFAFILVGILAGPRADSSVAEPVVAMIIRPGNAYTDDIPGHLALWKSVSVEISVG